MFPRFLLVIHTSARITLEETQEVETKATRTPAEDIWPIVIEDFEYAIANFQEEQNQYGRATANAARHALAKVHLILENWDGCPAHLHSTAVNSNHHLDKITIEQYSVNLKPLLSTVNYSTCL